MAARRVYLAKKSGNEIVNYMHEHHRPILLQFAPIFWQIESIASPDAFSSTRHQSTDPQQNSESTQPGLSSGTQLPPSSANAAATALPSGIVPNQARPADALPSPTSPSLATALLGVVSALGADGGGIGLTDSSSQGTNLLDTILSALLGAAGGNTAGASAAPPGNSSGSSATSVLQNLVAQGLASYLEGQLGIRNTSPSSGNCNFDICHRGIHHIMYLRYICTLKCISMSLHEKTK